MNNETIKKAHRSQVHMLSDTLFMRSRPKETVALTAQTVMENGPTAVSEFKNGIGHRVELENRYGSLAHREFESLPLRQPDVAPMRTTR